MKRLMIFMLLLMLPCAALANSWGAPGGTVELFEGNPDYADYTCKAAFSINDQSDDDEQAALIMGNRYHHQLICARKVDGHWQMEKVSTTAVYQPGHEKAEEAILSRDAGGFTLFYPDEEYEFTLEGGQWVMSHGLAGGLSFSYANKGVEVDDGQSRVYWQVGEYWDDDAWLTLDRFNISLLPRSTDEVRRMNALRALVNGGGELLGMPVADSLDESLPVYSAPSEDSWRAAEGKATVSLRNTDGLITYGEIDGWELIEYKVSLRTSRIGCILRDSEPLVAQPCRVPAVTVSETYLTDDPNVSQYPQMRIPADSPLTALYCFGPFYVYVETELDGQAIRGFVPMRDLAPAELPAAQTDPDALVGAWLQTVEERNDHYLALSGNGFFTGYNVMSKGKLTADEMDCRAMGRWYVRRCPENLFENQYDDMLILICDDGRAYTMGLALQDGALMLNQSEAPAALRPVQPEKSAVRQAAMERIAGSYRFEAGGTHLTEGDLVLTADGLVSGSDGLAGTWSLTGYDPAEGYIWNNPPYTAYFELEGGVSLRLGCMPVSVEGSPYAGVQNLIFSDSEGSGGYTRSDVDVDMMQEMSGNYAFVSGGPLLTGGPLRLHPEGYFFSEQPDGTTMSGFWMLRQRNDAFFDGEADYLITFLVDAWSPIRPGDAMTYGLNYTPHGAELAQITITDGKDSATYAWEEIAGNG